MIDKVLETIKKYNMIKDNDGIVLGVSGGPDSLCLLDTLYNIKDMFNIKLYVVHVNHMLRGNDADRDARYVEELCCRLNIPFFLFKEDVKAIAREKGYSEEQAGREVRYKVFNDILNSTHANKIAVAHNRNDVAETVLLNILRGTGTTGLIGIRPVYGNIIRPLIEIDREEIENYIKEKGLKPVIDKTNFEHFYKRNKIRLNLIPYIKNNFGIDIIENLVRTSKIIIEENDYLDKECEKVFSMVSTYSGSDILIDIGKLKLQHEAIKKRIIRHAYEKIRGSLTGLEYKHVEDVLKLTDKETSSKVVLPFEIEAVKSYNNLILRKLKDKEKTRFCKKLNIPGITEIENLGIFKTEIIDITEVKRLDTGKYKKLFDLDKICGDVLVRQRLTGDVISPLNMKGTKKLKEFFIDEKIPLELRDEIPIIAIGSNVLWIVGYRISEKFKLDDKTRRVLVIEYTKFN